MKYVLMGLLKLYRLLISPLYGNVCRYYPSCSAYALRAVEVHGALKGSWLAGRRLLRCHPWTPGGYDPVPGTPESEEEARRQAVAQAAWTRSVVDHVRGPHAGDDHHPPATLPPTRPELGAATRSEMSDQRAEPAHVRGVNCST